MSKNKVTKKGPSRREKRSKKLKGSDGQILKDIESVPNDQFKTILKQLYYEERTKGLLQIIRISVRYRSLIHEKENLTDVATLIKNKIFREGKNDLDVKDAYEALKLKAFQNYKIPFPEWY